MPTRLRSLMLACAIAALVSVALPGSTSAAADQPPTPRRGASKRVVHEPRPTLGARAATIALEAVGVPYRWGGASPASGFDCSGLVYWAYGKLGVKLPHSSYALYDLGRGVARSRLKAGDLLFFFELGHVGLYIGRGRMVHAPGSGRRVEIVNLGGSYYRGRLIGARRIVFA